MHIMVTGGAGFLGTWLRKTLAEHGHTVFSYDIDTPDVISAYLYPQSMDTVYTGSVDDIDALLHACQRADVDAIVHTAGRVGFAASLQDPVGFYHTNVIGTANVCEAARQLGVKKLILISSNTVYHAENVRNKLRETDAVVSVTTGNPNGHYGASKLAAEAVALAYGEFHGLDVLALRVPAIYGFGMRIPLYIKPMVENAVLGKSTRFASGGPMTRDYTHVRDCCQAVALALSGECRAAGGQRVFNVAAGRLASAAQIAAIVRREIPGADIEIGDTLTPAEAANMRYRHAHDTQAIQNLLGWQSAWPLQAGIRDYISCFRAWLDAGNHHG